MPTTRRASEVGREQPSKGEWGTNAVTSVSKPGCQTPFGRVSWGHLVTKRWFYSYLATAVLVGLCVLFVHFEDKAVEFMHPIAEKVRGWTFDVGKYRVKAGYGVPVLLLIGFCVCPLPIPLIVEVLAMIIGLAYGMLVGFLLVVIGLTIGEACEYWLFRLWFAKRYAPVIDLELDTHEATQQMLRAAKCKLKDPDSTHDLLNDKYELVQATMAATVPDHTWKAFGFILVIRYSAMPSHLVTPLFAVIKTPFWLFLATVILSMPTMVRSPCTTALTVQLMPVYLGTLFGKQLNKQQKSLKYASMGVTVGVSVIAFVYTWWAMGKVRRDLREDADDNKKRVRAARDRERAVQHAQDVEASSEKMARTRMAQSDSETESESDDARRSAHEPRRTEKRRSRTRPAKRRRSGS